MPDPQAQYQAQTGGRFVDRRDCQPQRRVAWREMTQGAEFTLMVARLSVGGLELETISRLSP
jgi:hypothetical protein